MTADRLQLFENVRSAEAAQLVRRVVTVALVISLAACGRKIVQSSHALATPTAPSHGAAGSAAEATARRAQDRIDRAVQRPAEESGHGSASAGEPQPQGMLGATSGHPSAPVGTSSIVTTSRSAAGASTDSVSVVQVTEADRVADYRRRIAGASLLALALIACILWIPPIVDRIAAARAGSPLSAAGGAHPREKPSKRESA